MPPRAAVVKKYEVSFRPAAEADVAGLYEHILREAGQAVAGTYIDRLEAFCRGLEISPERGTKRDGIRPGLRTIGFERRATIVFRVGRTDVVIVRVFYGGQDYERALKAGFL